MRSLTENLFNELKNGELHSLLEYVQNDDTLDMEFRNNSITIYYRGGNLLSVTESKKNDDSYQYTWKGINEDYLKGYKQKHEDAEQFEEYIPEAKHIIDRYICKIKNHLGEKEIQQLIVRENNYSPNSQDTDYFIVDMEYEETQCKGRFDLIALRWDSKTPARKSNEVSLAVIEVKQGYNSIRTNKKTPGLKSHQEDFNEFKDKWTDEIKDDFLQIFKQKCELGLILANEKIEGINQDSELKLNDLDFICLLANYKKASKNLHNELEEMGEKSCKFIRSHYMGYGLYADEIFTLTSENI